MTVFDAAEAHRNKYTLCYVSSIKLPESTIHTRHPSRSAVVKSGVQGPTEGLWRCRRWSEWKWRKLQSLLKETEILVLNSVINHLVSDCLVVLVYDLSEDNIKYHIWFLLCSNSFRFSFVIGLSCQYDIFISFVSTTKTNSDFNVKCPTRLVKCCVCICIYKLNWV